MEIYPINNKFILNCNHLHSRWFLIILTTIRTQPISSMWTSGEVLNFIAITNYASYLFTSDLGTRYNKTVNIFNESKAHIPKPMML